MTRPPQQDYYPKKLGVQYDPPTIVLQYFVASQGKSRFHRMRIGNISESTEHIVRQLRSHHEFYFHNGKLTDGNIRKLVEKIKSEKHGGYKQQSRQDMENNSPLKPIPIQKVFSFTDPPSQPIKSKSPQPSKFKQPQPPQPQPPSPSPPRTPTEDSSLNYDEDFEQFEESGASKHSSLKSDKSYSVSREKVSEDSGGFEFLDEDEKPKEKKKKGKQEKVVPMMKKAKESKAPPLFDPTPIPKTQSKPADFDFQFL